MSLGAEAKRRWNLWPDPHRIRKRPPPDRVGVAQRASGVFLILANLSRRIVLNRSSAHYGRMPVVIPRSNLQNSCRAAETGSAGRRCAAHHHEIHFSDRSDSADNRQSGKLPGVSVCAGRIVTAPDLTLRVSCDAAPAFCRCKRAPICHATSKTHGHRHS